MRYSKRSMAVEILQCKLIDKLLLFYEIVFNIFKGLP